MKKIVSLIVGGIMIMGGMGYAEDFSQQRAKRVEDFFDNLGVETLSSVKEIYHSDAVFVDPMGENHGHEEILGYYRKLYEVVKSVSFEYDNQVIQGDRHVLPWTMTVRNKDFKKDKDIVVQGLSMIQFDQETDQIIYHRDYFDMGQMIYEHIPVMSWVIRRIFRRFKH